MKWSITTGPASEPVTIDEAKTHLRVDSDDENTLIQSLISAARAKVEQETGRSLLTQTVFVAWDEFPASGCLDLPLYPAASVSSVRYIDTDGALQTWPSDNYTVDTVGMTPRIVIAPDGDSPEAGDYPNAIQVEYIAGSSVVPEEIKAAIKLNLGLLYEYRADMPLGGNRSAAWLQFGHRNNLI